MPALYQQDPDDLLDYVFDFAALTNGSGPSDWLAVGETISSFSISQSPPDLGVSSASITHGGTAVTVWLTGGTSGHQYTVTCHIITSAAREVDQTFYLNILSTAVVPVTVLEQIYDQVEELEDTPPCAISLPRYAKLIGYEEAAFWGVIYENQPMRGCDPLWDEFQRMQVSNALAEAQQEIEQVIGYPLQPTWVVGTLAGQQRNDHRWVDQQAYRDPIITRYPRLIEAGVRATKAIERDSVLCYSYDISSIGPVATDASSVEEIRLYYPGSDRRIFPSKITLSGGYVTAEIPRYRLVRQGLLNTPQGGIEYDDLTNFLNTVDVIREYNDPSTQAVLVRPHCTNNNCTGGCGECTQTACLYFLDPSAGIVDIRPATWDIGIGDWGNTTLCDREYQFSRLYYRCGLQHLNLQAEMAILRLAHTKMPSQPCSCDRIAQFWTCDREIPPMLTRSRLNCPFGLSNGAWVAYKFAMSLAAYRASIF